MVLSQPYDGIKKLTAPISPKPLSPGKYPHGNEAMKLRKFFTGKQYHRLPLESA
jgi:hypothetical protein